MTAYIFHSMHPYAQAHALFLTASSLLGGLLLLRP